jgi:hypothetical protein
MKGHYITIVVAPISKWNIRIVGHMGRVVPIGYLLGAHNVCMWPPMSPCVL